MDIYFSPDTSLQTIVDLIESAQSSIDIMTPAWASWIGCTDWDTDVTIGCSVEVQKYNETFPVWRATLNALARGVKVRIVSNNQGYPVKQGNIDPFSYLILAGAEIHYFTSVTFMHAKYICIDHKVTSVSSINFSKTSLTKNREAGFILRPDDGSDNTLIQFMQDVFEYDFSHGPSFTVNQNYSQSDMNMILNRSHLDVVVPDPIDFKDSYVTKYYTVKSSSIPLEVIISPDFAYQTISDKLSAVKDSFSLYIYQVTGPEFCDQLLDLHKRDISLKFLFSRTIFAHGDYEKAQTCYKQLYDAGVKEMKITAPHMYTYSHQKYWIIDEGTSTAATGLSTGNWGMTDYPEGDNTFPVYASSAWRRCNRDFTIFSTHDTVISTMQTVFDEDYERGEYYHPYSNPIVLAPVDAEMEQLAW
jgi:phosphatidylserine/phosphatidylglycerophosphate/cardiolipin synthase-like enzyme